MTLDHEDAALRDAPGAGAVGDGGLRGAGARAIERLRFSGHAPATVLAVGTALPAVLVAAWVIAGLPLVAMHLYRPAPAILLGLIVFALLGRPALRVAQAQARRFGAISWWPVIAVLAVVVGFGVLAFATSAHDVVVRRDPGSYSMSSLWLANHGTIEMPDHAASFGGSDPSLVLVSQGFYQQGGHIVPQFMTGVPIVMAVGGWVHGISGILHINAFIGAFALLAFAGLVARLVGPGWAPLATLVLALAQPQLDVMRATYSEPAAQLLMMGGLVVVTDALRSGRLRSLVGGGHAVAASDAEDRASRWALLVGGVVLGAVLLVRLDALADLLPVIPFCGWLAFHRRREWRWLAGGVALGLAAGLFDCLFLTLPYVKYAGGSVIKVGIGFVAAIVLTIVVVRAGWVSRIARPRQPQRWPEGALAVGLAMSALIGAWLPTARLKWHVIVTLGLAVIVVIAWARLRLVWWAQAHPDRARSRRWPAAAAIGIFAGGMFFFLRPHLMTMRSGAGSGGAYYVGEVQRLEGLPYDPTRSYYEDATRWMSWYVGWATLALALAAAMWLAYEQTKGRRREWLLVYLVFIGMSAAVLAFPTITPDHPWADRRFVPVAYPAVAALSVLAVAWAFDRVRRNGWQTYTVRSARFSLGVVALVAIVMPTWMGSRHVFTSQTEKGEVTLADQICARLKPDDAVVAFGAAATSTWPGTLRIMCGVGTGYLDPRTAYAPDAGEAALARIAARVHANGGRLMVLVDGTVAGDRALVPGDVVWQQALTRQTTEVAHTLIWRPDSLQQLPFEIWLGEWKGPAG